jgi:hypothetical protein
LDNEEWAHGGSPLARDHTQMFGQQDEPVWDLSRLGFTLRSCETKKKGVEALVC